MKKSFVILVMLCALCSATAWAAPFTDNGSTVSDIRTGLVWQKQDDGSARTWDAALSYCEGLPLAGQNDWRLPNIKELESITDDLRYSPAIDPVFTGTKSSSYWSSTTYAGYPSFAWSVDFYYGYVYYGSKSHAFYVRCVRGGQSGSFGLFDHFEFSNIPSPKAVGIPFSVTITKKDAYGSVMTGWNGWVVLNSTIGNVYPTSTYLSNGTATINMKLDSPGCNVTIAASGGGKSGVSNYFTVSGGSANASISGTVKPGSGGIIAGATVKLSGSCLASAQTAVTDSKGVYRFSGLNPGEYSIQAFNGAADCASCGTSLVVEKPISGKVTINLYVPGSSCNPNALTPILLVPGIMGSSIGGGGVYPVLSKTAPKWNEFIYKTDSWGLHDPMRLAGWRNLVKEIRSVDPGYEIGCTIFPVPYDWRMDLDDAAKNYLKKWIDEALKKAGTEKVNIIAHSMGGLVTRAYIQGGDYEYDIDKFAMVGTPNHGAEAVYYMWEGGDPKTADSVSFWHSEPGDAIASKFVHFYQITSEKLYSKMYQQPLDSKPSIYNTQMYKLFHEHVLSAEQLLPTFGFLIPHGNLSCETNDWLDELNSDNIGLNLMGKESDTNKVKTKIFAGTNKPTMHNIKVGSRRCDSPMFYKDGEPWSKFLTGETSSGDGTVMTSSASLGSQVDFADSKTGSHASLIDIYKCDLVNYVTGKSCSSASAMVNAQTVTTGKEGSKVSAQAVIIDNELTIAVNGRVQLSVVDPLERQSGIDTVTDLRVDDIPDSIITADVESGNIIINDAADGTYTVYLKNVRNEDFGIALGYLDSEKTVTKDYTGFNHSNTTSFTFTLDSASADKITVNHTPLPPTGLQADAVDSGGLKTALTWTASTDLTVTGYNIYAKYEDEPYLAQIGTSVTNSFNTGNAWAENDTIVTSLYAVSAVKSDSTESFLSNMVQNDDRDHDGLTDAQETSLGTNLSNPDTDGDGLTDGEEYVKGTNPLLTDTDVDGYSDYAEVQAGSDPLDINSQPSVDISIDISLLSGWNLISLPVQPNDTSIDMCLNNVANMYNIVWSYESSEWMMNNPATPIFNTLDTMEAGKGYWIYMTAPGTLTVSGGAPTNTIQLVNGWNLVGYNSDTGMPIADVLASIDGKYISVWAFINNEWFFYAPENIFSSLETMEPGYGYWINTTEACTWRCRKRRRHSREVVIGNLYVIGQALIKETNKKK